MTFFVYSCYYASFVQHFVENPLPLSLQVIKINSYVILWISGKLDLEEKVWYAMLSAHKMHLTKHYCKKILFNNQILLFPTRFPIDLDLLSAMLTRI